MTDPVTAAPVGVLSIRVWRDDDGVLRHRIMAKLDVLDPGPPELSHPTSSGEMNDTVSSWLRRYEASSRRAGVPRG